MILVGIGCANHDTSICAYIHGKVKYCKYERYSGIKHANPPVHWFFDKLRDWGVNPKDVDSLAYTSNSGYFGVPQSHKPPFDGENIVVNPYWGFHEYYPKENWYLLDHHYAHAFSCSNYTSSSKAVILDGTGSAQNRSLILNSKNIEVIRHQNDALAFPVRMLGARLFKDANPPLSSTDILGKMMGLQAYGKTYDDFIEAWKPRVPQDLYLLSAFAECIDINIDGNNPEFQNFIATFFDIGYEATKRYFDYHGKDEIIYYSGGTALNVNWNKKLLEEGYKIDIEPHCYDGGLSIGCVRYLADLYGVDFKFDNFPYIQDDESPQTNPSKKNIDKVSDLLAQGKIVGWYQGNGEVGPRALGNRSILMNPYVKDGKDILNQKVKHREWWRPFGASVKQDKASEYFDLDNSPYMLYTAKVLRDDLPSITHVDGTCRHQTVTPDQNVLFYNLLDAFENKTGLPVLLNTSLNVGGKPIAGKIEEAIELFKTSDMDALCVGDDLYVK